MSDVKVERKGPAALLILNRPEVRNAISPNLIREVQEALTQLEQEGEVAAVIITGEGKAFSGGADLANLRQMTGQSAESARQDTILFMNFFRRIYEYPKPVIAAVNGPAMGGGCGLASVCDLVLAAEEAIFGYTEVRVGFIPALVSVFLVRICGEKVARDLLFTGRVFSAQEAREIGLVNQVVPREELLQRAQELVAAIAKNSPTGVRYTKELLRDIPGLPLEEALWEAVQFNTLVRTTEDFREGVSAFLDKRPPAWKGR